MSAQPHVHAVSLMSTLAVKSALVDVVIPAFTASTGIAVHSGFDPTNVLRHRISGGERADLLIATRSYVSQLAGENLVDASSVRALVRTGVGLAVAANAVPPLIGNVDELRVALLNARSIAYSRTGASGVYFATLIERLGIRDQVDDRATIIESGFTGECVARGEADIAIQQMSELAMVNDIAVVGPFPEEVQFYSDFDVATFSGRTEWSSSHALREALFSDIARHAFEHLGLTVL